MSSFPLTFIFFRGVGQPPTRLLSTIINHILTIINHILTIEIPLKSHLFTIYFYKRKQEAVHGPSAAAAIVTWDHWGSLVQGRGGFWGVLQGEHHILRQGGAPVR